MEAVPNGLEVFDLWLAAEATKADDPLKVESAAPYRAIWTAWLKKLPRAKSVSEEAACRSSAWTSATAADVARFVGPEKGQRSSHNTERQRSMVTRRRYFTLLDRIYSFAKNWVPSNPVAAVEKSETPIEVEQLGHVLATELWELLPAYFPAGDELVDVRDRAALALIYELALAPEEVRNLRTADLAYHGSSASGVSTPSAVSIVGKRANQSRTLQLELGARSALQAWLACRGTHCAQTNTEVEWLFFSIRGRQLSVPALFTLVSAVVLRASQDPAIKDRNLKPMRVGPQVLRNTAIVEMYRGGMRRADLVPYLGLKNEKGLDRLRLRKSTRP
ncbi:tyrosine-type recombinase/integrase [Acidovorax sp. LjRoot118]|uniref:tyrosine-type recombinase/integrase n=1 Tax=Acidovorax sp. LjRoot118 TaxID=3342256 RepID=UPI003ECCF89B